MDTSRRDVLRGGSVLLAGAFAGCSNPFSGQAAAPTARIARVNVVNADAARRTVRVLLLDGSDPVYSRTVALPPGGAEHASSRTLRGYPTAAGDYTLYVWLDGQPREEWKEIAMAERAREGGESCYNLDVRVVTGDRSEGETAPEITFWHNLECEYGTKPDGTTSGVSPGGTSDG